MLTPAEATDVATAVRLGYSRTDAEALVRAARWSTTYPLQRVRKGGRRFEAICPMVAPSLAADAMRFAVEPVAEPGDLASLDALLRRGAERFQEIAPDGDPILRCLVLVLPNVRGSRLLEAASPSRGIKGELLKGGVMMGEFFPSCPFATTFNRRLFALRSPVTMVVLRTFIEGDWRFICREPAWQAIYRDRFGDPPKKLRHLGGFWWRLKEKVAWKIDSLLGNKAPEEGREQP